jgi:hypothetical protein
MSPFSESARANAPVIARLEPSPNNETHDAASPTRPIRPRDHVGTWIRLTESKYRSSAARTRSRGALEVLLRDGHADPDAMRERLQRATAVALRPWT